MVVTAEQARLVKAKAGEIARSRATVTGVGLTRVGDSYAVKVNLEGAADHDLPGEIDGVQVVYEVTGSIAKRLP
ncbi:MAG: hypothetical protein JWO25_3730 [Alphaproteobacteria bacterium]|nr:hypothetical protein [Alphaproteobacteria bacterium]MDB5721999.1 hypothetical protein [Alphaproteobacteria bacterium]